MFRLPSAATSLQMSGRLADSQAGSPFYPGALSLLSLVSSRLASSQIDLHALFMT